MSHISSKKFAFLCFVLLPSCWKMCLRFIFNNKTLSDDHKNPQEIILFRISAFHSISISQTSRSSNLPFSQTHSFPNHSPNIPPSPWARSSRHMSLAFEAIAGHTMARSWKCHHGRAWDPGPTSDQRVCRMASCQIRQIRCGSKVHKVPPWLDDPFGTFI